LGFTENYGGFEFGNGDVCFNGRERTAVVELRCDDGESRVLSMEEIETCRYKFVLLTALACNDELVSKTIKELSDRERFISEVERDGEL
jgi:hypothetical protein